MKKLILEYFTYFLIINMIVFAFIFMLDSASQYCQAETDNYNDYRFCLGI